MKNFPHQFNDLDKLFNALVVINQLIEGNVSLQDDNFGEYLTRNEIYTYRDSNLTIDEFLEREQTKPRANRGYLTVARDIRRLFQLLGFLIVSEDRNGLLSTTGTQLLNSPSSEIKKNLWKNSFMQLGLEGTDGEISHPYRILIKLVQEKPGIETKKLMLALEAENDSEEEYQRILSLAESTFEEIIEETRTSVSMARNAVKILPAIAEQLGDIRRQNNKAYPVGEILITEDEITTEVPDDAVNQDDVRYSQFRLVDADKIATAPIFNEVSAVSIDLTEAVRIRQDRLALHQQIVRKLASLCESKGFRLFEGKFDCLAVRPENTLLFEVKTIKESLSDQEKQTVKGVGQLKYYNFSIVHQQMEIVNRQEFLVYSEQPNSNLVKFCHAENIDVIWLVVDVFKIIDKTTLDIVDFDPVNFI
jgi:hypothetical protein